MERKKKILSLLIGSAIGDALGVPYEFRARGTFCCTTMIGNGTHLQPVGTWSDDTTTELNLLNVVEQESEITETGVLCELLLLYFIQQNMKMFVMFRH